MAVKYIATFTIRVQADTREAINLLHKISVEEMAKLGDDPDAGVRVEVGELGPLIVLRID